MNGPHITVEQRGPTDGDLATARSYCGERSNRRESRKLKPAVHRAYRSAQRQALRRALIDDAFDPDVYDTPRLTGWDIV